MQIPQTVAEVLARLHGDSRQAYLVGGCVRDMVMGRPPKDWDVATDARPDELLRLFSDAVPIGVHFGVILWRGVEIATFRSDGPYPDGRHPASVHFETDPAKDAARRDFTFNGLFFDVQTNKVLDFVNGQADIANKVLRAIGSAQHRFAEDYLRLLRAVRFAANFGFAIEPATAAAIQTEAPNISHIAAERIREELSRILTGNDPRGGFELLHSLGLLSFILPEVSALRGVEQPPQFHPEGDVWTHTMMMLDGLRAPSLTLALGVLLHDIAKPVTYEKTDRIRFNGHAEVGARMASGILNRLRFPGATVDRVHELVAQHLKFMDVARMKESTRKRFLRQEFFPELLELHRLDCVSSHRNLDAYQFCQAALQQHSPEELRPGRFVSGSDLIALGIPPGPEIGRLLRLIEDAQLDGTVKSRAQALDLARTATEIESSTEPASEPSST